MSMAIVLKPGFSVEAGQRFPELRFLLQVVRQGLKPLRETCAGSEGKAINAPHSFLRNRGFVIFLEGINFRQVKN